MSFLHLQRERLTNNTFCLQNIDGAWKKQQEFDAVRAAWLKTVQMQQQQPMQPDMQAQQQQQQQVAMAQQMAYPDAGVFKTLVCIGVVFWQRVVVLAVFLPQRQCLSRPSPCFEKCAGLSMLRCVRRDSMKLPD